MAASAFVANSKSTFFPLKSKLYITIIPMTASARNAMNIQAASQSGTPAPSSSDEGETFALPQDGGRFFFDGLGFFGSLTGGFAEEPPPLAVLEIASSAVGVF